MLRVIGDAGNPASRVENRIGEPTANPYLYIASQLIAGRDGINKRTSPGSPSKAAYLADTPSCREASWRRLLPSRPMRF